MILNKIKIKNFGKFKNFILDFKNGFQTIYGANEYGKTTIVNFIKIMFYSRLCGEKSGIKDKIFRKKYLNWDSNEKMSGEIEFTKNDYLYSIYKEISLESPSKDKILLYNKSTGEKINLRKKEEIGEWAFGLDLKGFERSCFIGKIGKISSEKEKNSTDSLKDKIISNLSQSGDETLSQSTIINRIDVAIKDLEQIRGNGGKILKEQMRINEIHQELINLRSYETKQASLHTELEKLNLLILEKKDLKSYLKIFELQKEAAKIEKILKLKNENLEFLKKLEEKNLSLEKIDSLLKNLDSKQKEIEFLSLQISEKNTSINNLSKEFTVPIFLSELDEKIQNLNQTTETLGKKLKKLSILNIIIFLILCAVTLIGYLFKILIPTYIILALFIVSGIWYIFKIISKNKNLENIQKEIKNAIKSKNCENENQYQLKCIKYENYINLKENYQKLVINTESLKNNFINLIGYLDKIKNYETALQTFKNFKIQFLNFIEKKREIENILNILDWQNLSDEELSSKLQILSEKIKDSFESKKTTNDVEKRLNTLEKLNLEDNKLIIQKQINPSNRSILILEENLMHHKQKLSKMKKYLYALKSAKNTMETTCAEIRSNFGPNLDKRASKIFAQLSGNKYKNLHIQKDFKILIENGILMKECENFSNGTIDQAYLALRIAISELICGNCRPPLILDDTLMQYDDERTKYALEFFQDYSKQNFQIILFSCHLNSCI